MVRTSARARDAREDVEEAAGADALEVELAREDLSVDARVVQREQLLRVVQTAGPRYCPHARARNVSNAHAPACAPAARTARPRGAAGRAAWAGCARGPRGVERVLRRSWEPVVLHCHAARAAVSHRSAWLTRCRRGTHAMFLGLMSIGECGVSGLGDAELHARARHTCRPARAKAARPLRLQGAHARARRAVERNGRCSPRRRGWRPLVDVAHARLRGAWRRGQEGVRGLHRRRIRGGGGGVELPQRGAGGLGRRDAGRCGEEGLVPRAARRRKGGR
jgi:hypothetical protein